MNGRVVFNCLWNRSSPSDGVLLSSGVAPYSQSNLSIVSWVVRTTCSLSESR